MGERIDTRLDEVFFALSHRARRRMLTQLSEHRETRVTDLARAHRLSLNTVSKHILVLERAKLVRRRVAGREHLLRLELDRLALAGRWIEHHRQFWTDRLERLADLFTNTTAATPRKDGDDD